MSNIRVQMAPAVSVVIPAYNAATDIPVALGSVFRQTFSDFEVIVVNDGSPDTAALESALTPCLHRIRYFAQANAGAAAARNTGILAARGSYIALLDADDFWDAGFLASQVAHLRHTPGCALVYADARISGQSPLAGRTFMQTTPSEGPVTVESLLRQQCTVLTSTVVARRDRLIDAGLFDASLRRGHDFDLWVRMAKSGFQIEYHRAVLAERRVRRDGLSGDAIRELERAVAIYAHVARTLPLTPVERAALRERAVWIADRLELERARVHLTRGNFNAARRHLGAMWRPGAKARVVRFGLTFAPGLVRFACTAASRLAADSRRAA